LHIATAFMPPGATVCVAPGVCCQILTVHYTCNIMPFCNLFMGRPSYIACYWWTS